MIENKNNFGFLRLFFALLVISSHSPELIDGNRARELFNMVFGTISFGVLAVDGFFLISGYLILKSYQNSLSTKSYLFKRILRIYPAFIVATLFSILIIAPLSGGGLGILFKVEAYEWLKTCFNIFLLKLPSIDQVFANNHYPSLNGPMWTIKFEFICYFLVPALCLLGLLNKKYFFSTSLFFIILFVVLNPALERFDLSVLPRLFSAFSIGGCYYLYQDKIKWNLTFTLISIIGLLLCIRHEFFAELGLIIFGGYLLFNFALNYKNRFLNAIGSEVDISYGVYLYAWPVQNLFVQYYPTIEPYQLTLAALVVVLPLAYLSFKWVEKPCIDMKKSLELKNN